MPEYMAWKPAIPEPSKPKGNGKGKSKHSSHHKGGDDATPIWPKTTKSAAQQGQMAILCCLEPEGVQFFWT
eukprot:2397031-Heterocapsa_arctica.AAC.1